MTFIEKIIILDAVDVVFMTSINKGYYVTVALIFYWNQFVADDSGHVIRWESAILLHTPVDILAVLLPIGGLINLRDAILWLSAILF